MEDFEMTQALRRYVEAGEPPFSLTANALISQARQRQRWRLGLVIGGGGAATALAIVSAVALVPAGGGGAMLGPGGGCDVRLPRVAAPTPRPPYPTDRPPTPSNVPLSPGPLPSGRPTPSLSGDPFPTPRPYPTDKAPRPTPSAVVAFDAKRLDEMSCFLKHRLLELRPKASFAPHLGGPMEVRLAGGIGSDSRKIPAYESSVYIVDGPLLCLFTVTVIKGDYGPAPGLRHSENQATATYKTRSSTIVVTVEGGAIQDGDAMAIAKAPELDMFR